MPETLAGTAPGHIISRVLPAERLILATELVCLGRFRCDPRDPAFAGGEPCSGHTVVFPRRAVWIQHDRGRAFVADSATIPLYNRGQIYQRRPIDPRGDACEWMAFPTAVIMEAMRAAGLSGQDQPDRPFDAAMHPATGRIYANQRVMFEAAARGATPPHAIEEQALLLLDAVVRHAATRRAPAPSRHDVEAVEEARRLINLEGPRPRRLSDLAAACGVSPYRLCRDFRRVMGMTMTAYRTRLKIFAALEQLPRASDLTTLALDSGFCSHSHFTAAFRTLIGTPPSKWRQDFFA